MKQSVIGMFEKRNDAIRAHEAVQKLKIADADLNLMPAEEPGESGLTPEEFARYKQAIRLLLDEGADQEAAVYLEALQSGGTLLTVTSDQEHLEKVEKVLRDHGAKRLADRASGQWAEGAAGTSSGATVAEAASEKAKS